MKIDMITSSNGNISRGTGLFCGKFTGHRCIPRTKASDAELWYFLWSAPEPTVEQMMETLWFDMQLRWLWHDVIVMDFAPVCLEWKDRQIEFVIIHFSLAGDVSYQVSHWKIKWDLVLSQTKTKRVGIFILQYDWSLITVLFICKMGSTSQWRHMIVMASHITVHECLFQSLFAPTTTKH